MHPEPVPGLNKFTQRQARAKYIHEWDFSELRWPDAFGGGTRAKYIYTASGLNIFTSWTFQVSGGLMNVGGGAKYVHRHRNISRYT